MARLLVTRLHLARTFDVHADSVAAWLDEGLRAAALVKRGGPGRAALFEGARAVAWFNGVKVKPGGWAKPVTLVDLEAAAANSPKSRAMTMLEQSFSDALKESIRKTPRHRKEVKTQ